MKTLGGMGGSVVEKRTSGTRRAQRIREGREKNQKKVSDVLSRPARNFRVLRVRYPNSMGYWPYLGS
jgi:hypothetical protein